MAIATIATAIATMDRSCFVFMRFLSTLYVPRLLFSFRCVALFVIISFFINLPLGALFVLGSNLTVMCKATRDLTLIEKVSGNVCLTSLLRNLDTVKT